MPPPPPPPPNPNLFTVGNLNLPYLLPACLLCLPAWPVLCCCAAAAPLQADPPEFTKIPPDDIVGVTVILLTCSYKNQVGGRAGGWVCG